MLCLTGGVGDEHDAHSAFALAHVVGADAYLQLCALARFDGTVGDADTDGAVEDLNLLDVEVAKELIDIVPEKQRESLIAVLAHDPRPQYQDDPERVYGMAFDQYEVRFKVKDLNLTVIDIKKAQDLI